MFDLFTTAKRAPGECLVSVEGTEIADLYPFLMEVTVDASRADAAEAVLTFETRRDVDGTWIVQDDDRIRPWRAVRIDAAFGEEIEEVMRGFIREVRVELPEDSGAARVTVTAQDDSLRLDREHKRRPWGAETPTTDAAIAAAIIGEHDLRPEAPPGPGQSNLVVNQDETDVKFLKKRAEANGYELIFREGAVYFGPRRFDGDPQATIMVYAGPKTNCRTFSIADDGHQPDRVIYEIAAETGAETDGATLEPDLPPLGPEPARSDEALDDRFAWRMSREGVAEPGQARATAQERANETSLKVKAEGTLDGALYGHVLKVGLTVGVDGVGSRHSGKWYVDTVRHSFDINGYSQDFALLRNAYGDNLEAGAGPLGLVV